MDGFEHPLLAWNVSHAPEIAVFLKSLRDATYDLVVMKAGVQQLETRGKRVVAALFDELVAQPTKLIPTPSWNDLNTDDSDQRRVCDYIAGMSDPYAERVYHRLFTPGYGSSSDEL